MDSQFLRQGNSSFGLQRKFMFRNNFYHNLKQLCTAVDRVLHARKGKLSIKALLLYQDQKKLGTEKRAKLTGLKCQGQSLGQIYFGVFLMLSSC